MGKNIYITKDQAKYINESIKIHKVEPQKVLLVKKYLDKGFKKGEINGIGDDGYPKTVEIVAMIGNDGNVLKNMTDVQMFYLLQDRFKNIYSDEKTRSSFLAQVLKDWYKNLITKQGLLSVNLF